MIVTRLGLGFAMCQRTTGAAVPTSRVRHSNSVWRWAAMLAVCMGFAVQGGLPAARAQRVDFSGPPINYMQAESNDAVAQLADRVRAGQATLDYDEQLGYLPALLDALDVPVSSQTLVFSKTSLQRMRISPRRPRAVYFNDDVYIGYCQNGELLEIAATDADQGAMFYTLSQERLTQPKFERDQGQCLACHVSNSTQDVPGYLVRSLYTNAAGLPDFSQGTYLTDHTSPLSQRWGGWYVTGTHGTMRHMGNTFFNANEESLDLDSHANLRSLDNLVATQPYLSPHSDIVSLMVMEHQTQMHNAIAWANYETRRAIYQSEVMNEALERPEGFRSDSTIRRMNRAADRVLEFLLMCDEFPLTSPVEGTSSFTDDFPQRGLRDARGRSLRDFDLTTRLFRYPCSYLIHSDAFHGLPDQVRHEILVKLLAVLDGKLEGEQARQFAHLDEPLRAAIKQILAETQPEFGELVSGNASKS